jgi:formylglycine-generating enzyme required for sulfatase activity
MLRPVLVAIVACVSLLPTVVRTNDDAILKRFADEFVELTPGAGKFPASFQMGSAEAADSQPVRMVTLKPFAICKYETTQELYEAVLGANPAKWKGRRNSIEEVSWHDAIAFCDKVTMRLREAKLLGAKERIRLPSEAEWEYACRAGTTTAWSFGDDAKLLGKHAWFKDNSPGNDPPVGAKSANPWGLYDMHGYNWEWCLDDWAGDYKDAPNDGSARRVEKAKDKVIRGGAWPTPANTTTSAHRAHAAADRRDDTIGFRCVKVSE